ncbi:hypothetical protein QFC19_002917 [Naganishia cerealis]|uniref:Uncharacterized protein n=1 Tax=Naganishia cerealis TaxID=610337 RepID=A0ACC2W5N5_9TREE|nr:hypothetical protein QFC19_002917 [Naganishia cerealis]
MLVSQLLRLHSVIDHPFEAETLVITTQLDLTHPWPVTTREERKYVEGSVSRRQKTQDLYTSYNRLSTTTNNQQLISEARQELETSLGLLEVDIDDLEESVAAVEESGTRWGLTFAEVERRRKALEDVKAVVRNMRSSISDRHSAIASPSLHRQTAQSTSRSNAAQGRHSANEPFSDIELGHTGHSSHAINANGGQYKDDPYAGRPSDEVREYELEQQQVGTTAASIHHSRGD